MLVQRQGSCSIVSIPELASLTCGLPLSGLQHLGHRLACDIGGST